MSVRKRVRTSEREEVRKAEEKKYAFDHEKLDVYQKAVEFNVWVDELMTRIPAGLIIKNQFERAALSIALNIAEGNGRSYPKDRCRFLGIARGSALECSACLDVLNAKEQIKNTVVIEGKEKLNEIVALLMGLMKAVMRRKTW